MGYRPMKTSLTRIYSMAFIKSQILRNKDPIMKMPYANGVSSVGITLSSATNLCDVSYVWVMGTVRVNAATHTNAAKLPSHAKFVWIIPGFIMPVVHRAASIVIPFR
jgi:hypothetical protein